MQLNTFMKIIIVGGGTAGWLAALIISKVKPEHSLTVIDSSSIGIIGAGEGSTGLLTNIIAGVGWDYGCDHYDFLKETGATLKYGIKHINWTPDKDFYYGPLDGTIAFRSIPDGAFAYHHAYEDISKIHTTSEMGILLETKKSNVNKFTKEFNNFHHALHFDAHDVGRYFKKIVQKRNVVTHIDSEIVDVCLCNNGFIKSLKLNNGQEISGDFFIDASGFKKILSQKLETSWVSYRKNLPVNAAMPFLIDYKENEYPEPYTTAWAQSSGWMWQIPTQKRKGCGYVFCDEFISPDQAHTEIEKTLGRSITPLRILKFDTGRLENVWTKNCLSIGLSAAFAEPLEATSIHSTIVQLQKFVFEFLKPSLNDTINEASVKLYNTKINKMYDDFKEFLVLHYMGGRTDSEFWRYITAGNTVTEFVENILDSSKSRMPTFNDFHEYYGAAGWPLWAWILAGIKKIPRQVTVNELTLFILGFGQLKNASKIELQEWQAQVYNSLADNLEYSDLILHLRSLNAR